MDNKTAGKVEIKCNCGKLFLTWKCKLKDNRGKYCSRLCRGRYCDRKNLILSGIKRRGISLVGKNPKFKGWMISKDGYKLIRMPQHPNNNGGYIREHRLIMEQHLGRYLTKEEVVHHKNHKRTDNRIENLELMANSTLHMKTEFAIVRKHFVECKCKCHRDLV